MSSIPLFCHAFGPYSLYSAYAARSPIMMPSFGGYRSDEPSRFAKYHVSGSSVPPITLGQFLTSILTRMYRSLPVTSGLSAVQRFGERLLRSPNAISSVSTTRMSTMSPVEALAASGAASAANARATAVSVLFVFMFVLLIWKPVPFRACSVLCAGGRCQGAPLSAPRPSRSRWCTVRTDRSRPGPSPARP